MILLQGLDIAEVLVELYKNAKKISEDFTEYWDYLDVQVARNLLMKNNNEVMQYKNRYLGFAAYGDPLRFSETLYNRYNGEGEAQKVIKDLRKKYNVKIDRKYKKSYY